MDNNEAINDIMKTLIPEIYNFYWRIEDYSKILYGKILNIKF
jgi:hypothetical protein